MPIVSSPVSNPRHRRIVLVLAPVAALLGCNALIGIDPPNEVIDDGGHDQRGGAGGASAADAAAGGGTSGVGVGPGGAGGIGGGPAGGAGGSGGTGLADAAGEAGTGGTDAGQGGTPITGLVTRVSVSSDGTQGNNDTENVSVSGDGNLVTFASTAENLVLFDYNKMSDIFLYNRATRETTRVSLASDNSEPNGDCRHPVITADGKTVVFTSTATNLAASANAGNEQIFSRWLATPLVDHRSRLANDWASSPAASGDGGVVAFQTSASTLVFDDTNGAPDIYAAWGGRGQVDRISIGADGVQPNGSSYGPAVSADGSLFAFWSTSSNLVKDDTNGVPDVFVRGLVDKNVVRVSVSSSGEQANALSGPVAMSGDGRRVAFCSSASNLVAGDTNKVSDVFVHDLSTHETVRVSVSSGGVEGNDQSCNPSLSGDGRLIAFSSNASNLVPDDVAFPGDINYEDIFVHDLVSHTTVRVSVSPTGTRANGYSTQPSISANGHLVVFVSAAPNLVLGDTNGRMDAFAFEFTSAPWL